MKNYIVLLRGINVGGRNKIKLADLRDHLVQLGFQDVQTYIQSGNVCLRSSRSSQEITKKIEKLLIENFKLDSKLIKVLTLCIDIYKSVIEEAPKGYGENPDEVDYRYDVLFLMNISPDEAMQEIDVREGIDRSWKGTHVIYYRRPGPTHPDYTKSALSKLARKNIYQSITIRNWKTTMKMWELINK
ncbi:DUF1697 domain-containing protein [Marinilactibacillus kalidii]|uniref:DUF1697 domain-containing protein n=1 Tax=Marinilactibacillus kalidii TaxID=2820274 RepID=UPI001ABDFBE9|nr:DUF1697 domain-containing protein [Marinilactibacillus kalidii]